MKIILFGFVCNTVNWSFKRWQFQKTFALNKSLWIGQSNLSFDQMQNVLYAFEKKSVRPLLINFFCNKIFKGTIYHLLWAMKNYFDDGFRHSIWLNQRVTMLLQQMFFEDVWEHAYSKIIVNLRRYCLLLRAQSTHRIFFIAKNY